MAGRRETRALRGAIEIAVLFAALSWILPWRGIPLMLGAAVVGFVVGLLVEQFMLRR